jgi:hypothetical protein
MATTYEPIKIGADQFQHATEEPTTISKSGLDT